MIYLEMYFEMLDVFHAGPNSFSSATVDFELSCAVDVVVVLTESI
jgi:hypothetical protein